MAFGSKFAGIEVKIGADTSRLGRDMRKADGIVGRFSKAASNALMGVGVAAAGAAIKIGVDGVKAYIEDEKAARKLAVTLENVANAKKEQIASVEEYITKTMFATGVADDELRPAMARLLRSTQDITKSQKLLNLSLDISAGTGKSLDSVAAALGKSYDGSNASLGRLGLGLDSAILKEGKFSDITKQLRKDFQGFAEADANTMEGKLARLNLRWQETKEQIGGVILEGLEPLMDWFETAEGQKTIENLMGSMVNGFKTLAENLPEIIEGIKTIMNTFKDSKIDLTAFADPKLLAAAMAWKYTPGPFQIKAIAALAAYQLGDARAQTGDEAIQTTLRTAIGSTPEVAAKLRKESKFTGSFADLAMQQSSFDYAMNAQQGLGQAGYTGSNFLGGVGAIGSRRAGQMALNNVNITINQAVDPKQTAISVQRAIAKAERMGINTNLLGKGLGN